MSTKSIIISQITNFITELSTTYPDNNDIIMFKEKFIMVKSINSQLIIDYFIKYVYTHKEMIKKENDDFFLNGGGQEEINDKYGLSLRDNLKDIWSTSMTDDNKKIVWRYFKTFVLLIDKYILENA